jgi:hypothetical protein
MNKFIDIDGFEGRTLAEVAEMVEALKQKYGDKAVLILDAGANNISTQVMIPVKEKPKKKVKNKFSFILEKMDKKTPTQIRQSLIDAGIITEAGQLTDQYKPKKSPK